MLGLSDTTLGALISVLLHAGVVAACFGPQGAGVGERVVMVSVEGVAATIVEGEQLVREEAITTPTRQVVHTEGDLQVKTKEKPLVKPPSPQKRIKRPPQPPQESAQDASRPSEGGGGVLGTLFAQPRLLSMPKPLYPRTARERGIEGTVGVRVLVDAHGKVERAEVVQSSGLESFDQAALESVFEAQFSPALKAGIASVAEKIVVVTFSLLE